MKSLYIVNKIVDQYENDNLEFWGEEIYQIKKDLEVLEIIKKLFGNMEIDIWRSKRFHKTIGEIRFSGTDFGIDVEDFGVTLENLQKLKQWLEENE